MARTKTPQAKLANKYNKRIKEYNKIFGEGYAYNIYTDIDGVITTKKGISAKTFTSPDSKYIIEEFESRLKAPKTMIKKMAKDLGITSKKYSKEDIAKIVENIIAKDEVEERFDAAKEAFYIYDATGLDLTSMTEYNDVYDVLYHEGKWDSYTEMLDAIKKLEEFLSRR